jgi:DeoR/GlpR family transcriptional regulator of sugar metabolism
MFSREAGVLEMTIRRDLEHLVRKGVARRVYGGAVLTAPSTDEPEFAVRAVTEAADAPTGHPSTEGAR